MISKQTFHDAKQRAAKLIRDAGIVVSDEEINQMDVADFGLSNLYSEGAQIVSIIDTPKVAARVIALFPHQTEPEHWHQPVGDIPGKEETIRVIKGDLLVVTEGSDTLKDAVIPEKNKQYYTCRHEVRLKPCEQITFPAGMKHWFQAAEEESVFYTISTTAIDSKDPFTNPHMVRKTVIG